MGDTSLSLLILLLLDMYCGGRRSKIPIASCPSKEWVRIIDLGIHHSHYSSCCSIFIGADILKSRLRHVQSKE